MLIIRRTHVKRVYLFYETKQKIEVVGKKGRVKTFSCFGEDATRSPLNGSKKQHFVPAFRLLPLRWAKEAATNNG